MKRIIVSALLALSGLVVAAVPASAVEPPYNIDVGVFTSGTYAFTSASAAGVSITIAGPLGPVPVVCTSVMATGTFNAGYNATGIGVGAFPSTAWSGCTLFGSMAATVTQVGTWRLNGTGPATVPVTDDVVSNVGSVSAQISAPFGVCTFGLTGSIASTYKEASQQLVLDGTASPGTLVTSGVSGCLGRIANGNSANVVMTLPITSPSGALNFRP